jgi:hypothetical protein
VFRLRDDRGVSERDSGLVLVFGPLESYRGTHLKLWQLLGFIAITVVIALAIFSAGVAMERRRP